MCTHGHPHIPSHGPLKTSTHLTTHIHVSPVLSRLSVVEYPRKWCPVFHSPLSPELPKPQTPSFPPSLPALLPSSPLKNRPPKPQNLQKPNLAHFAPLVSRFDSLASSTNQCHHLGFTRTQTNHVLLLGRRIHRIPRVFDKSLDPNCNSRVAATIFDVSSPISIGQHHDRTLRRARTSRNIKIATNDHAN